MEVKGGTREKSEAAGASHQGCHPLPNYSPDVGENNPARERRI